MKTEVEVECRETEAAALDEIHFFFVFSFFAAVAIVAFRAAASACTLSFRGRRFAHATREAYADVLEKKTNGQRLLQLEVLRT